MNSPTASLDALLAQASQLRRAGRVPEAIAAYERLLALYPALQDSWYNLGYLRQWAQHWDAAMAAYREALARGVKQPEEVHLNLAVILSDRLARPDEAQRELQTALRLNPRYVPALLNLGNLHEHRGERPQALAAYEGVLALEPGNALALARLPTLKTLSDPSDPLITRLQAALARPGASDAERADLGFGLGKALDDVGAYDPAFAAYTAANEASRRSAGPAGVRYDAAAQERLVDRLIAAYPLPSAAPAAAPAAPGPAGGLVFICGMFRSGSTLVEQMLAAHPAVTAGGELDLLPALVRQQLGGFGHVGDDAGAPARQAALRQAYLQRVATLFPGARWLTDKRPDNFLHIGLIKTLFPDARIVHTRRHPLDNCLSVFFLHLTHAMPYALDLQDIAHWYRQYRRLMAHWKALYGDSLYELDYDELVADPRAVLGGLLAHCGLPWDEACLSFHAQSSVVRTASVWQVRQPLYHRSSGRWRHYERHLAGLAQALGDVAS